MVYNSAIRGDEKNEKNEKEFSGIGGPPVGDTIILRDAARTLADVAPSKKGEKISDGKLLRALKSGEIRGGFHCSTDPLIWISIPQTYWVDITSDDFRRIRYSSGKKNRTGAYKVTLKDFPKQYMSACIRVAKDAGKEVSPDWMIDTFYAAVNQIGSEFEVEIPKENWEQYLATEVARKSPSDVEMDPDTDFGSGRKAYSGWKALNAMLAAYLVAYNIRSEEDEKAEAVAAIVYERVKNLKEKTRLPKLTTFEKEVGLVFGLIEQLQKK